MSRDGLSALGLACEAGHVDVVQQLASHSTVDVNAGDSAGRTPLVAALEVTKSHCSVGAIVAVLGAGSHAKITTKITQSFPNVISLPVRCHSTPS